MSDPEYPSFLEPAPLDTGSVGVRARVMAVVDILLCSDVPTQMAIATLLRAVGVRPTTGAGVLSLTFVTLLSALDTVVLVGLMTALLLARGERPGHVWLGRPRPVRDILLGLASVPVLFLVVGALMAGLRLLVPAVHNIERNPLEQLVTRPERAMVFGMVAIVAGGLREELQRAFLLTRFERYLGGTGVGVVVLSVAFGLGHLMQGIDAAIATGTLGLFWALVYVRRRSTVAPVVSHAGFNALEVFRAVLMGG